MSAAVHYSVAVAHFARRGRLGGVVMDRDTPDRYGNMTIFLVRSKPNRQIFFVELCFDAKWLFGSKAKIDVIPENRRVAVLFGKRTGNDLRVGVAFDYFKASVHGRVVECVRDLAKPSAYIRYYAALAKLAAFYISAKPARPADLPPKTERLACWDFQTIKLLYRESKIVDLAGNKKTFFGFGLRP